jgi:hypothetical protein
MPDYFNVRPADQSIWRVEVQMPDGPLRKVYRLPRLKRALRKDTRVVDVLEMWPVKFWLLRGILPPTVTLAVIADDDPTAADAVGKTVVEGALERIGEEPVAETWILTVLERPESARAAERTEDHVP